MRCSLRRDLLPGDEVLVRSIVASSGFFSRAEEDIAVELVEERRARGVHSGYHFLFLGVDQETVGYSCYGPIAGTLESYDLYWIAVRSESRRHGFGRFLMRATERRIARGGGARIYVETSSRDQYAPTRAFYESCGYHRGAELSDFYAPGDGKVIYCKVVARDESP